VSLPEAHTCSTAERVAYLASGFAFPRTDRPITVVETHTSWVFMGRSRVLKMKKPIRLSFLDFTTLRSRRRNAMIETRLNRRLAPGVYFDPVALRLGTDSRPTLSGTGEVIDWLVDMRRLPQSEMLDERIRTRRLSKLDVLELAQRLADFYEKLIVPPDSDLYLRHLEVEAKVNRQILNHPGLGLDSVRLTTLLDLFDNLFDRSRPLIEARLKEGRIVEGHGDLRPCHVCLTDPPVVFDCLEFDRSMRLIDPLDELNFLGLECAMLGAAWVRRVLVESVLEALGDRPTPELAHVYGAFRMLLRARLCAAHLIEDMTRDRQGWLRLTKRYLSAAWREITAADGSAAPSHRPRAGA
jgi:aminoglycoside phosphotransferase family enzyme